MHCSCLLWPPCVFCSCGYIVLFFLAYSQQSEIGCLPYVHTWCGPSANLQCRSEICCMWLAGNTGRKNDAKNCHCTTLSSYISTTKACIDSRKKLVKQQYLHMSLQYGKLNGPLTAEIGSWVWGTTANFNEFRYLVSLLQWRCSPEANQTLHDVWPSLGLVHYIHLRGLLPLTEFCRWKIHFASKSCLLLYWQRYCTALQQRASAKLCGMVQGMELRNFHRGCHLYSAGRPSRWASAHILVRY